MTTLTVTGNSNRIFVPIENCFLIKTHLHAKQLHPKHTFTLHIYYTHYTLTLHTTHIHFTYLTH